MSVFGNIRTSALDPVVVSFEAFLADSRESKINLGVGMYYDDRGAIPLMQAVARADRILAENPKPWGYVPVEGLSDFRKYAQQLVFGRDSAVLADDRVVSLQTIGGTGAIRLGADLLHELLPGANVAVSNPSWPNHPPVFEASGFKVVAYPYYDVTSKGGLDFPGMLNALEQYASGTIIVLHACCHNPTGVDLEPAQWAEIGKVLQRRSLVPFIDLAYQGFGVGIEEDAYPVRLLAEMGLPVFVAVSFSKSFALYGERVGMLSVVVGSGVVGRRLLGQVKNIVRTHYSTPATHGAAIVGLILGTPELEALWRDELDGMRRRISAMREGLVDRLREGNSHDFSMIMAQRGLFSYSGLTPVQVESLKTDHAIYALETSRICVAAVNSGNVDRIAAAIRRVM